MLCHLFPYSFSPGCGKWIWAVGRLCSSRRVGSSTPWDTSVPTMGLLWSKVSLHHVLEINLGHHRAKDCPLTVLPTMQQCCTAHSASPGHILAGEGMEASWSCTKLSRALCQLWFAAETAVHRVGLLLVEGKRTLFGLMGPSQ